VNTPSTPAKRPLTAAELQQRRDAAQKSTGPRTEEGKARSSRNAWKHGLNSTVHRAHFDNGMQSLIGAVGKPCLTTCPKYPCGLVEGGLTREGGNCLDKQVYVQAFSSIIDAVQSGEMAGVGSLMAAEISAMLQMLNDLRAQIAAQGLVIGIPMTTSDGDLILRDNGEEVIGKYVANPGYAMVLKTLETLGISLPELLATPQAKARAKVEGQKVDAMQTMLGGIFQRANAGRPAAIDGAGAE
jgi:hypothetical protein